MRLEIKNHYDEISFGWMPLPVMSWHFSDSQGHEHQWVGNDEINAQLPTLKWVVEVEADDEYPERGHYECIQCGESVHPLFRMDSNKVFHVVIGIEYLRDDEPITREEFEKEWTKINQQK